MCVHGKWECSNQLFAIDLAEMVLEACYVRAAQCLLCSVFVLRTLCSCRCFLCIPREGNGGVVELIEPRRVLKGCRLRRSAATLLSWWTMSS